MNLVPPRISIQERPRFKPQPRPTLSKTQNAAHLLARLNKPHAPWFQTHLGQWTVGLDSYHLAQFLFVGPRGGGDYYRIAIFAGIHGDETAGIHAAIQFLEELAQNPEIARGYEIYLYPLVNPGGYELGARNSRYGKDLNREFWNGSREPEVRLLEHQIRALKFDGIIALHADDETDGLYAFALGSQITHEVVEPALAAAERVIPVNREPNIDNFTAKNGLIRKGYPGMLTAAPEQRPRPFEIVFETPQLARLDRQIEAHLIVLRTVLEKYQQLQAFGQSI